jgi:phthalate 4,5-dioxygenase
LLLAVTRGPASTNRIYSGIHNIVIQDQAVADSLGTIMDHTKEHLAPSDVMISRTRPRHFTVARAFEERD